MQSDVEVKEMDPDNGHNKDTEPTPPPGFMSLEEMIIQCRHRWPKYYSWRRRKLSKRNPTRSRVSKHKGKSTKNNKGMPRRGR